MISKNRFFSCLIIVLLVVSICGCSLFKSKDSKNDSNGEIVSEESSDSAVSDSQEDVKGTDGNNSSSADSGDKQTEDTDNTGDGSSEKTYADSTVKIDGPELEIPDDAKSGEGTENTDGPHDDTDNATVNDDGDIVLPELP